MSDNLPAHRDDREAFIAAARVLPFPAPAQPSRIRRAVAALLADPSPTPVTDAIDDMIAELAALREYVAAKESITAGREQARTHGLRRWLR